jgi:hypothetical protein
VERNDPRGARLAQPAHAEEQEQDPDGDLQRIKRHGIEQSAQRNDDERQHR